MIIVLLCSFLPLKLPLVITNNQQSTMPTLNASCWQVSIQLLIPIDWWLPTTIAEISHHHCHYLNYEQMVQMITSPDTIRNHSYYSTIPIDWWLPAPILAIGSISEICILADASSGTRLYKHGRSRSPQLTPDYNRWQVDHYQDQALPGLVISCCYLSLVID